MQNSHAYELEIAILKSEIAMIECEIAMIGVN